jgi:colanic acid/amylovoran biosynthesis glycosyltransferase
MTGLPVVTTAVPGSRDVIDDGATGFVVPVEDTTALCAAVERLARDPDLRARMGSAAREHAVARFDIQAVACEWRSALDRVVDVTTRPPGARTSD